jgi:hypothetical protein
VRAERRRHTRLPQRVQLVDEDDARRPRLRLREQVANARRSMKVQKNINSTSGRTHRMSELH